MEDNIIKTCVVCNTEKSIAFFSIINVENVKPVKLKEFKTEIIFLKI